MPVGQDDKGIGEVHDLIIKTDGLLEGVIVGVGKEATRLACDASGEPE